jgi:hypothetical protein
MDNKAREINSPLIKQLIDETSPEELAKIDADMDNKQQTAVDSIIEFCKNKMFMEASVHQVIYLSLIKFCQEQAKEMEKQMTIKLYVDYENYLEEAFKNQCGGQAKVLSFEEFYEQTYGDDKQ